MKTLHLSIIAIVSVIALVPQFSVLGQEVNMSPLEKPEFTAKMDKMYYNGTDTAHVTISGPPSTPANLVIIDSSSQQKLATVVQLDPNGTGVFSFNLTSYNYGIYSAMVGYGYDRVKISFGVGLMPSGPPPPMLTSIKSHYLPNEAIQVNGFFRPNAMIQIDLVDPYNNLKNSIMLQSDNAGIFQGKLVVPNDAVNGTWKINTSSGITNSSWNIIVISKNFPENQTTQTTTILDPLMQFKSGILAQDVKCGQGFQLIIKAEDGSPACVKPDTAQNLLERGWAKEIISNQKNINNSTSNNTITLGDIKYDTIPFLPDVKQTIDLDGISFTYTGNGSVTKGDCYGTWVNQTEAKSFSVTADNEFNDNAYQCWPPTNLPPQIMENGKPVNILPLRYAISFFDINQTAGVAECSSDICPLGKDLYLVKQGWNLPVTYDSPSLLQFYSNTNSSVIRVGQAIGIEMSDNNTQLRSIRVPFSYNYSFSASSLFPCDYGPFRVAVFEGNVAKENLNTTEPLHFYHPGDYNCQAPSPGKFWIFQPLGNTATLVCHLGSYCNDTISSRYLSFNGYWDSQDHFHSFQEGNYTLAGGDQWGHMMILHFSVVK